MIETIKIYVEWYKLWGCIPSRTLIQGVRSFKNRDFRNAAISFEKELIKNPKHKAAKCIHFDCAISYYKLDLMDKAYIQLSKSYYFKKPYLEVFLMKAGIERLRQDFKNVNETLKIAQTFYSEHPQIISLLLHCSIESGDYISATKYYEEIISLRAKLPIDSKDMINIDTAIAHYHVIQNDLEQGEQRIIRVLASGEFVYEAFILRARLFYIQEKMHLAKEQCKRCISINPHDARSYEILAKIYLISDNTAEGHWAVEFAKKACELTSWKNAEYLALLSRGYYFMEDFDRGSLYKSFAENIRLENNFSSENINSAKEQILRLQDLKISIRQ